MSHLFDRLIQRAVDAPPDSVRTVADIGITEIEPDPAPAATATDRLVVGSQVERPIASEVYLAPPADEEATGYPNPVRDQQQPAPLKDDRTVLQPREQSVPDEVGDLPAEPSVTPPDLAPKAEKTHSTPKRRQIETHVYSRVAPTRGEPVTVPAGARPDSSGVVGSVESTPQPDIEPGYSPEVIKTQQLLPTGIAKVLPADATVPPELPIEESRSADTSPPGDVLPDVTVTIGRIDVTTPPPVQPATPAPPASPLPPAHMSLSDYMARKRPYEQ